MGRFSILASRGKIIANEYPNPRRSRDDFRLDQGEFREGCIGAANGVSRRFTREAREASAREAYSFVEMTLAAARLLPQRQREWINRRAADSC
jgi:hypothetical protein